MPLRTLDRLDVSRDGDEIHISPARGPFCTSRCARWSARWSMSARANGAPEDLKAALDARDRARCGKVAPADGLYLMQVVRGLG